MTQIECDAVLDQLYLLAWRMHLAFAAQDLDLSVHIINVA